MRSDESNNTHILTQAHTQKHTAQILFPSLPCPSLVVSSAAGRGYMLQPDLQQETRTRAARLLFSTELKLAANSNAPGYTGSLPALTGWLTAKG